MKASGAISISPACKRALDNARIHQIIKRVIDRSQIGIDLLAHVARQETEPLAGFDGGPGQDDTVDFLAFEHLHRLRDGKPGLAGACGPGAKHQRMALERADIGVLRGRARTHRPLAQIDFFEGRTWRRRVIVEQRALRDGLTDGAFDVALAQIVAALELFVETFQDAARLLAGATRALDGDMIAALFRDHAEPALDQREVLSVLAEQHRG